MSEMIERVARAIADKRHRIAAEHNLREIDHEITEANIYAFGLAKVFESDRLIARAAIEAMREPTEEVYQAGREVAMGKPGTLDSVKERWKAMIGAALNPAKVDDAG